MRPIVGILWLLVTSSPVELFARNHLDVLCVVRRRDHNTTVQVTSILRAPPRHITGKLAWFDITDYVYSCPVPPFPHNQHASVSIRYDTRCYFNVRSKADMNRLNLPHGDDN